MARVERPRRRSPVRLVVRPGVDGRFGEVKEGVDALQRRPVDVGRLDRLEVLAGEARIGRVDDERRAGRSEGARGDQMKCRRLTQLGEPAVQYSGVRQEDAPLPWPEVGESRVEIVCDHAAVEPVDHPVAEADRQDARRRGSGRRGEFGADGGEGAGHPVGSDLHVDARVVVEVDEQRGVLALAHAEEGQGNRFRDHRVVEDSGVGAGGQVPDAGLARPVSNGAGTSSASSLTKTSRPSGRTATPSTEGRGAPARSAAWARRSPRRVSQNRPSARA